MMRMKLQLFAEKLDTKNSIVDLLKSQGKDSSYSARKELAQSMGIKNYVGSEDQNVAMIKALSGGGSTASTKTSQKANNTQTAKATQPAQTGSNIKGVDKATADKINSTFTASDKANNAQSEADTYLGKVKEIASVTDIVDQSTWDALNKQWEQPQAITDAWNYTNGLLEQLSSGRTSYTDQIKDMMNQIQNRDKFSYDVDSDTMFQQALSSAMSSGKTAMQDTIGQASALTGGYGSTYATTAGNQAYNSFIQDAYDNLPEYYQMALEAYQMEGQDMYNQLAMLNEADANEYQRMYNSWQANFSNTQQMYNNAFNEWQTGVGNAYNSASLQLQEHGQLFDQAYNAYTAVQNNANTIYAQEYQNWADTVNNALNLAKMANSDYWSGAELTQRKAESDADIAYKYKALQQDNEQYYAGLKQDNDQFNTKMTAEANETKAKKEAEAGKVTNPSSKQMEDALKVRNEQGESAYLDYLEQLESMGVDVQQVIMHVEANRNVPWTETIGANIKDSWSNLWR